MSSLAAGRRPQLTRPLLPSLASAVLLGAVSTSLILISPDPALPSLVMAVCLLVSGFVTLHRYRRGDPLPGVSLIPYATLLAGVGMVLEYVSLLLGFRGPPTMGNLYFGIGAPLLAVATSRYWFRPIWPRTKTIMLRGLMDSILIGLTNVVVYWHVVVVPGLTEHPDLRVAVLWGLAPIVITSVFMGPLVVQAFQRGDFSSWLLCLVGLLVFAGTWLWSVKWLQPAFESASMAVLCLAILVLLPATIPAATRHHRPWMVSDLGPMVLHFLAWGVVAVVGVGNRLTPATIVLGLLAMAAVTLRIAIVRASERRLMERLQQQVHTDPLTGCGNRRSIASAISERSGWVASMDLDGFKEVNDRFGHEAGDLALITFAERVRSVLPPHAHLARIGGDEFAAVFTAAEPAAVHLAERLVGCGPDPQHPGVSVSVGLAAFTRGADPLTVLRDADIAMQTAKRAGKNRMSLLDRRMVETRLRELELADALRQGGIAEITLDLQPIRSLPDRDRPVIAVEALARWSPPRFGPVEAAEFIEVAEQHGLISPLGSHVLGLALDLARLFRDRGTRVQISVNVSGLQLRDADAVEDLLHQLRADPDLTSWLILEVTETVFADDEMAVGALRRLRRTGAQIAIDDFGIGSSTLTRLRPLPVDLIKTDAELNRDLGAQMPDAVLDLVVMLGYRLGIAVIAEGVEDEATVQELVRIGCRFGQGHYLGPPAPSAEVVLTGVRAPVLGSTRE